MKLAEDLKVGDVFGLSSSPDTVWRVSGEVSHTTPELTCC